MAVKPDASGYDNFSDVTARLDEIVSAVRNKDTSLERSLDLFDEAIALGSKAVDMVDATDFSPEEAAQLEEQAAYKDEAADEDASGDEAVEAASAQENA